MCTNQSTAETGQLHRRRALKFAASVVLFIFALLMLLDEVSLHKRSKVELLTPAEIISKRSAKAGGYATIKFSLIQKNGDPIECLREIDLGGHYKSVTVSDYIHIFPVAENFCATPIWPKNPQIFFSVIFFFMTTMILIFQFSIFVYQQAYSK